MQQCLPHLEVLVNHEVAANQVKEAQAAFQLGFDCKKTLRHDLLHALLKEKTEKLNPSFIRLQSDNSRTALSNNI